MYTDVVESGNEVLELAESVAKGMQRFLLALLNRTLFNEPVEPVSVGAAGPCQVLEALQDGSMLLRSFDAPARYWLVFPDAPHGACSYWVQFDCLPPQDEGEEVYKLKLDRQHAEALSHLRGQRLRTVSAFAANR
jgi:hypothetical protein